MKARLIFWIWRAVAAQLLVPQGGRAQWVLDGLAGKEVLKLELHADTLYAATDDGLYRRAPGQGWQLMGHMGSRVNDFIRLAPGEFIVCLNVSPVSLRRTLDNGATWSDYQNGFGGSSTTKNCYKITAHPDTPDTLFAKASFAIAKSTDRGQTWTLKRGEWDDFGYQSTTLVIDTANPNVIYAGGELALFSAFLWKSVDWGETWTTVSLPDPMNNAVNTLTFGTGAGTPLWVGMEGRIISSRDGGNSWAEQTFDNYSYIQSIRESKVFPGRLYATGSLNGTQGGPLFYYQATYADTAWVLDSSTAELGDMYVQDLLVVETDTAEVLYFASRIGVYRLVLDRPEPPVGRAPRRAAGTFALYPNPASGLVTLRASAPIHQLEVRNLQGQTVYSQQVVQPAQPTYSLALPLPSGVYFLSLNGGAFQKFILAD
ncbi:MAG: T9SS type A sorting domain-containing protein [Sphingobacteriia bacterium]